MYPEHPSYLRVIVNKAEQTLYKKVIGEFRPYKADTNEFETPKKFRLIDISATSEVQASKVWDGYAFEAFGNSKNMEPILSNASSKENSEHTTINQDIGEARIAAWTSKVVSGADPEIAPEAPVEPAQPSRRRVLEDSDDSDDERPTSTSIAPGLAKLPMPLHTERVRIEDNLLEDTTLVSLVSSGQSASVLGVTCENRPADETDHLVDVDARSQLSSNTVLLAEKFPVIPPMPPALSQRIQIDNQTGSALGIHQSSQLEHHFSEEDFDELLTNEPDMASVLSGKQPGARSATTSPPTRPTSQVTTSPLLSQPSQGEVIAQASVIVSSTPLAGPQSPIGRHQPRPSFDANAYGSPDKRTRGGQGYASLPRGGNIPRASRGSRRGAMYTDYTPRPQPAEQGQQTTRGARLQRGDHSRASLHSGRQARSRGGRGGRIDSTRPERQNLVDIGGATSDGTPRVPPGFESHVPLIRQTDSESWARLDSPNIMDEPVETISTTSKSAERHSIDTRSRSTSGDSRIRFSEQGSDYRATFIPKRNQTQMREDSLRKAMEAIQKQTQQTQSPNKKRVDDESPPVHSTMRQQGKNPGKSANQQESKAQKKERLEKAKLEAYPMPVKQSPKQPEKSKDQPEEMSKWKRQQVTKNSAMAEAHPGFVRDKVQEEQTSKLMSLLEPSFEAARAFKGQLSFEISFGQVLVAPGPQLTDNRLYDVAGWNLLFEPGDRPSYSSSTFTNILTTNGADIDRALEIKNPVPSVSTKLWSSTPGPNSVTYEFTCQSKSNDEFIVAVDQSGNHELRKGVVTVGSVSIHVPTCIWDASARLSGHLKWINPPEALVKSAVSFVKSLYVVPGKEKLMIVFRQPTDHEIRIRNLIVKRVSYHDCNQPGCEDIQLKVVEAKSLLFKVHPQDKNLWQGYEAGKEDYVKHAEEGRIHYELSLVHKGINRTLTDNENLELGELTPEESTGQTRTMLDLALYLVSKIDFMGCHNVGTLRHLDVAQNERNRAIVASLGPAAQSLLQVPTLVHNAAPGGPVSQLHLGTGGGHSRVAGSANQPHPVPFQLPPGVRARTQAEVLQFPDGSLFARSLGGAKVPVPTEELLAGSSTIMPDDSASQIDGRAGNVTYHTAGSRLHADRGQGFW